MITETKLSELSLENIQEYFDTIMEARVKNDKARATELYSAMSDEQKKQFYHWFTIYYHYDAEDNDVKVDGEFFRLMVYLDQFKIFKK